MMRSRHHVLIITLVLLPLVLFHFQNCAPSGSSQIANNGGVVGIVDNQNKSLIQFVTPEAQIQDEAPSVDISGLCPSDHNGATMTWSVWDQQNPKQPLATGTVLCSHGEFDVELSQLDQYVCGTNQMLVVQSDWGASTESQFSRRCQPAASQSETPPAGSPEGTTCELEYSPATAAEQPCARVCYRNNQMVFNQSLDPIECSSLAAGLAGQ